MGGGGVNICILQRGSWTCESVYMWRELGSDAAMVSSGTASTIVTLVLACIMSCQRNDFLRFLVVFAKKKI